MLKKIAIQCGVAVSTVSTAFHHPEKISQGTRDRIFEVAHQLGYFSHKYKIKSIGICAYGLDKVMWSEFYTHILEGIITESEKQGILLKFFSIKSTFSYETLQDVSGMIFLGKIPTLILNRMTQLKIPYMLCADPNIEVQSNAIYFDNQKGAFLATDYLISKGHHHIAIILSDDTHDFVSQERLNGHQAALKKHGFLFLDSSIFYGDYENFDTLETVLGQIIQTNPLITAIFCESDVFAYKILSLASKFSIRIPQDMSIIGFDGISFPKIYFENNQILTTIETDMIDLGRQAFNQIKKIISERDQSVKSIILPVKLVVGNTVASCLTAP